MISDYPIFRVMIGLGNLPPQPWPTGTSKDVAEKLGLPVKIVSEAIAKLIREGVFDLQYYGKLYIPKSKSQSRTKKSQKEKTDSEGTP